jgi:large subunit ribosomal protein L21
MSYAVIRIKHQQFIVKPGDTITINGTFGEVGKSIKLGQLLLLKDKDLKIGTPTLEGNVNFSVVKHQKSTKITVSTFKAKSRYRRTKGHRQPQTVLELDSVGSLKKAASKTPAKPNKDTIEKPAKTSSTKAAK